MNTETINTQLYEKMFAEQERYRGWLLSQPPKEILNHTYEYTTREDILMTLENNDLRLDQAQALLSSPTPLADVFKEFENRETDYMDVVRDSMESCANTLLRWWKTPVYPHSGSYAREHEELEQYRASKRANIDCRDAIERAIADHYQHNVLSPEGAREVVRSFGFERTMFVLANTINVKSWDDRFGGDNREWAKTIPIEPDEGGGSDRRLDYVVDRSHSVLLDVLHGRCATNTF